VIEVTKLNLSAEQEERKKKEQDGKREVSNSNPMRSHGQIFYKYMAFFCKCVDSRTFHETPCMFHNHFFPPFFYFLWLKRKKIQVC
jgi:hypothetical protein